jgi:hypothetical protein
MPTGVVLGVLVLGWGAYLAYWWRDSRPSLSRSDGIEDFSRNLDRLSGSYRPALRTNGSFAFELCPRTAADAATRRRQIVIVLGVLAVVTLLGAMAFGLYAVLLHLLVDAALGAYLYAIVQRRNLAAEREIKVQMLYPDGVTPLASRRRQNVGS